jgi:ADP-heptose:LPS heptosyltransferase
MQWAKHEPPVLVESAGNNQLRDVAMVKPFTEEETGAAGLVFQHYAYATLKQLEFKEQYYGYGGAVHRWHRLQAVKTFPVHIRDYFYWILDDTIVDKSDAFVPEKLIELPAAPVVELPKNIVWIRTDGVGDGVLSSAMLGPLTAKYPGARVTVVCREYSGGLYEKCPHVHEIIRVDHTKAMKEPQYRESFIPRLRSLKADLCLYSTYSREGMGDFFAANSGATEKFALEGDSCNMTPEVRASHNRIYTRVFPSPGKSKPELDRHVDFLKGLGIEAPVLVPEMWTSPEDRAAAAKLLAENNFDPAKTIVLFAAALWVHKAYSEFGRALAGICRERGLNIVALGSPEEAAYNQKCLNAAGVPSLNLCGKIPLRVGAEILRACRLAVGVDTGRAHIACAVGTPSVVILGGAQMGRFLPYSPLTSAVSLPMSCYGCDWKCKHERSHCIKDIVPEVLEVAIREALDGPSKRPRLYLQHYGFHTLPAGTTPFFNPDMLPTMLVDVTYVAPDDVTPFSLQPPSFSGNLLRVVQIKRWPPPPPTLIQLQGRTAQGGMLVSFGGGGK